MEHFGAHAQAFRETRSTHGHDHEFLHIDLVVRMCASVEDVHQRHWKQVRVHTTHIPIEG